MRVPAVRRQNHVVMVAVGGAVTLPVKHRRAERRFILTGDGAEQLRPRQRDAFQQPAGGQADADRNPDIGRKAFERVGQMLRLLRRDNHRTDADALQNARRRRHVSAVLHAGVFADHKLGNQRLAAKVGGCEHRRAQGAEIRRAVQQEEIFPAAGKGAECRLAERNIALGLGRFQFLGDGRAAQLGAGRRVRVRDIVRRDRRQPAAALDEYQRSSGN